jgi:hypothetical protein
MSSTYLLHSYSADSDTQAGYGGWFKPFWHHEELVVIDGSV